MMAFRTLTHALLVVLASASSSVAQPAAADQAAASATQSLPEGCRKTTQSSPMAGRMQDMPMMSGGAMPAQGAPSEMGRDLMAAMKKMNPPMMMGMAAQDPDVAFLCSMIPHHQGAIDMARAALKHTKDEAVRRAAEKTIRENEDGIEEMTRLVERKSK